MPGSFFKAGNESAIITDFYLHISIGPDIRKLDSIRLILHVFMTIKCFKEVPRIWSGQV